MSKVSKTAKSSTVQAPKAAKPVLPDEELIRQLRIDRAAHLWPGLQAVDALLRAYDNAVAELKVATRNLANSTPTVVEFSDASVRESGLEPETQGKDSIGA